MAHAPGEVSLTFPAGAAPGQKVLGKPLCLSCPLGQLGMCLSLLEAQRCWVVVLGLRRGSCHAVQAGLGREILYQPLEGWEHGRGHAQHCWLLPPCGPLGS